ncbi:hypothetical protein SSX86_022757 [Deinandra increscens subsp. villosa]|uniref:DOMON domain-containing protein n=1 Tax=Deinandra increscens subsp. villosa TaxID=3103831 RepID=A0AAP0CNP6_9ASTR
MNYFHMKFELQGALLSFTIMATLFSSSFAKTCSNSAFASNKVFTTCNDLPVLNSFLHYTYNPSSETLKIAYRHTDVGSSRWVAWAINPTSKGMIGSQAIVAFQQSNGKMKVYTSRVTDYSTELREGELSFPVSDLSATYSNNEIVIFATLGIKNVSKNLNQVWQDGQVANDAPLAHATSGDNIRSMGTLNVLSGQSGSAPGGAAGSTKTKKRNVSSKSHKVLTFFFFNSYTLFWSS